MEDELVNAFVSNACFIQPCETALNCCSGSTQYVSIDMENKGILQLYKMCADVDAAITYSLENSESAVIRIDDSYPFEQQPSQIPSTLPSEMPFGDPHSEKPSATTILPSNGPSLKPSTQPTSAPSIDPSQNPSDVPSFEPSTQPTTAPSVEPSQNPSDAPSFQPSTQPTSAPSVEPSQNPSDAPSGEPSTQPTITPSVSPSQNPSDAPSVRPTIRPSSYPSSRPSSYPSKLPSTLPTEVPSSEPSKDPSTVPTASPSGLPSLFRSGMPSIPPSSAPSFEQSRYPSEIPSILPSNIPSILPTSAPSLLPASDPSGSPSYMPSHDPSDMPTTIPSLVPSFVPSLAPTQFGWLDVSVNYIIRTNGVSGQEILSKEGNTVASDLITATTTVLLDILGQSGLGNRRAESANLLFDTCDDSLKLGSTKTEQAQESKSTDTDFSSSRSLALYRKSNPVEIVSAIDIACSSGASMQNENERCVLIRSIVTVYLNVNENKDSVRALIVSGLRQSFLDGSFVAAIPPPPVPIPEGEQLEIKISYLIRTGGVNGGDIMSGEGNSILRGLVIATTIVLLRILEKGSTSDRRLRNQLPISDSFSEMGEVNGILSSTATSSHLRKRKGGKSMLPAPLITSRNLAAYHDSAPVVIESATDTACTSSQVLGTNELCVLIRSVVTVFLAEEENANEVRALLVDGIRQTFVDGSFLAEIPQ
eukprot:CAMPEP_0113598690 /NCGR_PEP_ID=MMETSP0015_2-20120614/41734_1 /TAXON_ID=2838 /ORGANISM="Odontella" /LENGTH=703 /DNA_ID=CAMNT_0000506749 /DNA_START=435 /DNA_END=2547 /DNA_ORIENTATION=- /assembly_acc=CAM_ASM_000160